MEDYSRSNLEPKAKPTLQQETSGSSYSPAQEGSTRIMQISGLGTQRPQPYQPQQYRPPQQPYRPQQQQQQQYSQPYPAQNRYGNIQQRYQPMRPQMQYQPRMQPQMPADRYNQGRQGFMDQYQQYQQRFQGPSPAYDLGPRPGRFEEAEWRGASPARDMWQPQMNQLYSRQPQNKPLRQWDFNTNQWF